MNKPSTATGAVIAENSDNEITQFYIDLLYKMHLTKGARYQAARRHQRRSTASIWSIIFLSMYVFSTSAALSIFGVKIPENTSSYIVLLNIIMSSFIIAFSVLEHGKKHDLKAELFLRCAQSISELYDTVSYEHKTGLTNREKLEKHLVKYQKFVNDFSDNHSETDYRTFRINIGKDQGRLIYKIWHKFKYIMDCWSLMWVSMLFPPIILLLLHYFHTPPL